MVLVVNATLRPLYPRERDPVPTVQGAVQLLKFVRRIVAWLWNDVHRVKRLTSTRRVGGWVRPVVGPDAFEKR